MGRATWCWRIDQKDRKKKGAKASAVLLSPLIKLVLALAGLGYSGTAFAQHIHQHHHDWIVSGTCTNKDRSRWLSAHGVQTFPVNSQCALE